MEDGEPRHVRLLPFQDDLLDGSGGDRDRREGRGLGVQPSFGEGPGRGPGRPGHALPGAEQVEEDRMIEPLDVFEEHRRGRRELFGQG